MTDGAPRYEPGPEAPGSGAQACGRKETAMATGHRNPMRIFPANVAPARGDARRKRIGILVVAYNALSTLAAVLKRIPQEVWDTIEEVAVFDDASNDETYEL